MADRHKNPSLRYRSPEAERQWLLAYQEHTGKPMNAILTEAVRKLRAEVNADFNAEEDPEPGTVGWLHDGLGRYPRDRKVIMAKDAEGNDYSPLAAIEERMYEATSTWSGEVYQTPEVVAAGPGEWSEVPDSAERVIVLGPVN